VSGNGTGNFLRKGYLSRATAKAGSMVRNCPVASKLLRKLSELEVTIARGRPSPLAPNASAIWALAKLSRGQSPTFAHQFDEIDAAPACPPILRACCHDERIIEKFFYDHIFFSCIFGHPCDRKLDISRRQFL
jgi:hypothetical protein